MKEQKNTTIDLDNTIINAFDKKHHKRIKRLRRIKIRKDARQK